MDELGYNSMDLSNLLKREAEACVAGNYVSALLREAAHAIEQCAATIATDTAKLARLKPMTGVQISHLVTEFHNTRRFHGNEAADIVRAVECFHGIDSMATVDRANTDGI